MEKGLKSKINPISILGVWTISMIVLTPVMMFISNIGASGGEQKPLITLSKMIVIAIYGAATLSILTSLFFIQWIKKNLWFCLVNILTLIPVSKHLWDNYSESPYVFSENNIELDGNKIKTKSEYYDEFKTLRSLSIWKNGKKDSVWKIYSKDGKIINEQTFKNDTLVTQ